jgi:uncharacterized sulfatase
MNSKKRILRAGAVPSILGGLALITPELHAEAKRPNIVFVLLDDFGIGGCQPYSKSIGIDDMDPHLVGLVAAGERQGGRWQPIIHHDPGEALAASQKAMPFLDRLAGEGVRFENAYAPFALCAPTRQALLSGRHPQRWGIYTNMSEESGRAGLPLDQPFLPSFLQKAGYATACIGKYHVADVDSSLRDRVLDAEGWTGTRHWMGLKRQNPELYKKAIAETGYCGSSVAGQHPLDRGFDYYFGYNWSGADYFEADNIWENRTFTGVRLEGEYNTELFTSKAIDFLNRSLDEGKPAFLYLAYHAMHGSLEYKAPEKYMQKFNSSEPWVNSFYGHVNAVDEGIREIFAALEARGQQENTLFILSADNGASGGKFGTILPHNAPLRGAKGTAWEGGVRVPFIVWWPGRIQCAQVHDGLVSLLDVMPTALDAAGVQGPDGLDGKSLLPLLAGGKDAVHDTLFFSSLHARSWGIQDDQYVGDWNNAPLFAAVRQGDWVYKIIAPTRPGLYPDLPDGSPRQPMLFNLKSDPGERSNAINEHPEVAETLRAQLLTWGKGLTSPLHTSPEKLKEVLPGVKILHK